LSRVLLFFALFIACSGLTRAQETPKAEAFVGYAYTRTGGALGSSSFDKNLNGWDGGVVINLNHWFGIEADVSGNYSRSRTTVQLQPTPFTPAPTIDALLKTHLYTFTGGPRVSVRGSRLTAFGHLLIGAAKVTQYNEGTYSFLPSPGPHVAGSYKQVSFALMPGGGINFQMTKSIGIRIVQTDYVLTRFETPSGEHTQNGLRVSTGIVVAF